MPRYRIEFRSYNIGADGLPVPGLGMGAAHNLIVMVEIVPGEAKPRVVRELHADSADEHGKPISFDATGRGYLKYSLIRSADGRGTHLYRDSERHPKFVLFEGTRAEVEERMTAARETGEVAALQESRNDANRVFEFAGEPLAVDGDLGPKTGAALVDAARAAGPERLADHVGRRLGIGERDLLHDPARGFARALDEEDDGAPALRALA